MIRDQLEKLVAELLDKGIPCEYAPEAPAMQHALPTGADAITVRFWAPNNGSALDARADVTGYELTLDGGTTWRPLSPTRTDETPAPSAPPAASARAQRARCSPHASSGRSGPRPA